MRKTKRIFTKLKFLFLFKNVIKKGGGIRPYETLATLLLEKVLRSTTLMRG